MGVAAELPHLPWGVLGLVESMPPSSSDMPREQGGSAPGAGGRGRAGGGGGGKFRFAEAHISVKFRGFVSPPNFVKISRNSGRAQITSSIPSISTW